uniref:Protein kinase domain-containing protein n=1 Tax=Globodera pallida TaxID=36090 RepID=A0A183BJ49_GLOPA
MIPQHFVRSAAGGAVAVPPSLSRDRPRSVVSNIEHGVVLHHRLPHLQTTAGQLPPLQAHVATAPPPPLLHHRPPPPNVAASSSASSLMAAAMIHAQQQQNGGYALSPAALAASASGSCMMNQSFHSVLDSTGGSGSPWASQQQLEGEIVLEHVLGIDNRRRLAQQQQQKSGHSPNPTAEPIRVAVPPPRPFQQQQQQQQQRQQHVQAVFSGTELQQLQAEDPSVLLPTAAPPAAARFRRCGESTAAYVNVDFDGGGGARHAAHEGDGILPECMNQQQLNVRELHRTDHSRMEFLSTGPGAFMLSSSYGPMSMSTSMVASPSSHATALPPALIHHHHHQQQHQHHQHQHVQQQYPQQCLHHSFYAPRPSASFQQQMSASVSGALTTSNQPPPTPLLQANNESGAGGDEDGIRRSDAHFYPNGPTINLLSPIKLMSPHAGVMQQHQSNPPLSNTTTASSTPS